MANITEPRDGPSSTPASGGADGRTLRRERNVEAARSATIELLEEGLQPSLAEIAGRAGVATRSVYRYFGDAESAISDAVQHRIRRADEVFRSEPAIGSTMPFDERLAMLILRRLRLERLVEPLRAAALRHTTGGGEGVPTEALDVEVRSAFASELADHPGDEQLALLLCALFRPHSVRSLRTAFGGSDEAAASALSRTVRAVLGVGSAASRG
ncbi:MAG: hypothetical protein AB8G26_12215 [Ilumatobacter sp.]